MKTTEWTLMHVEFRLARALANACEWVRSADAYESASRMAEALGATEAACQGRIMQRIMEANARG